MGSETSFFEVIEVHHRPRLSLTFFGPSGEYVLEVGVKRSEQARSRAFLPIACCDTSQLTSRHRRRADGDGDLASGRHGRGEACVLHRYYS